MEEREVITERQTDTPRESLLAKLVTLGKGTFLLGQICCWEEAGLSLPLPLLTALSMAPGGLAKPAQSQSYLQPLRLRLSPLCHGAAMYSCTDCMLHQPPKGGLQGAEPTCAPCMSADEHLGLPGERGDFPNRDEGTSWATAARSIPHPTFFTLQLGE